MILLLKEIVENPYWAGNGPTLSDVVRLLLLKDLMVYRDSPKKVLEVIEDLGEKRL